MPVIEAKGLSLVYSGGTPMELHALEDCSFSLEQGEVMCIIGHTGSGKSTLVQLLNGLLSPTSGTVLFEGKDIFADKKLLRQVRFQVGLVFQYPEHQLFEDTVWKDIAFGPKNKGLEGQELEDAVREAAGFAGLREKLLHKSPFDLSGGEKRRAAIAGVMAMRPRVLILDEPTAGLDPMGRTRMLDRIMEYRDKTGSSVVLVSHTMEDVARCADKVLVLDHGRVHKCCPVSQVFADAEGLERIGLRVPQVTQVMLELRRLGLDVDGSIHTVSAAAAEIARLYREGGAGDAE